jgi:hypothetical protein
MKYCTVKAHTRGGKKVAAHKRKLFGFNSRSIDTVGSRRMLKAGEELIHKRKSELQNKFYFKKGDRVKFKPHLQMQMGSETMKIHKPNTSESGFKRGHLVSTGGAIMGVRHSEIIPVTKKKKSNWHTDKFGKTRIKVKGDTVKRFFKS